MISWIGGKNRMSKWINEFIPKDIETFVEPFSGMMWVFLKMNLDEYPNLKTVVYNDFNNLNSNLFECTKQYDKLWLELSKYPCQQLGVTETPKEYEEMFKLYQKEVFNPDLIINDDNKFEIACKYVYVITQVFSGSKPSSAKYMDYKGKYRCKVLIFMDKLKDKEYRKHFDKLTFVECLDFEEVIEKYDNEKTFFYTDPPYFKTENYYSNHEFGLNDHKRLSLVLKSIKGKFMLSYYDFKGLDEWFQKENFKWEEKTFTKAAAAKKDKKQNLGTEILIMNYNIE
jgi:DNA adenine methylase